MKRKFLVAIVLLWMAVPWTAYRYWSVWDQLPARIATHFDAAGRPNGYMTPRASLEFSLGLTAFLLAVFTVAVYAAQRQAASEPVAWALLGFAALLVGLIGYGNASILAYNLEGRPIALGPILLAAPLGVIAIVAVYLGTRRGEPLPSRTWVAEEQHGSRAWAVVFLLPVALEVFAMTVTALPAARFGMGVMILLFVAIAAFAWSGFRYRFGPAGLEISTLGFRLRSIALNEIRGFSAANWNPLRGYGIRGLGAHRAYVWGNRGVRIQLQDGEVFLGHRDPGRVLRDLEMMQAFGGGPRAGQTAGAS